MDENIQRIYTELQAIGRQPVVTGSPNGPVITFLYQIPSGTHKGQPVTIGVSRPDGQYPEYPPHWVHVSPPINDGRGGAIEQYTDANGQQWLAMSRPPQDVWDKMPTKHMDTFIKEHLARIWKDV